MIYRILADTVLVLHLAFIIFVIFGGFLNLRWSRTWILHLPALIWGVLIENLMWSCPLTYLESVLRESGGGRGYSIGFIEHYVSTLVYPDITPRMHMAAGILLIIINSAVYLYVFRKKSAPSWFSKF